MSILPPKIASAIIHGVKGSLHGQIVVKAIKSKKKGTK
jgi:hypothetical protein